MKDYEEIMFPRHKRAVGHINSNIRHVEANAKQNSNMGKGASHKILRLYQQLMDAVRGKVSFQ